ncbi:hypothetical protein GCM10023189_10620 [Nibrella saemangeumensis]|uniref:DinB-like domain-containing protein n=1 Tax=Nibrella saemangeumensis TaxID=1084526 RepID=A0ABP8MK41_9BACT
MNQITTYTAADSNLPAALTWLRARLSDVPERLSRFSDEELTLKLAGKWSKKEALGHLIDSAVNNLKRITEVPFSQQPYPILRYDQDNLVLVNQYQQLPLAHLLILWQALNTQILYVVGQLPEQALQNSILLGNGTTSTLSWLIEDYIAHMEHHLKTLL